MPSKPEKMVRVKMLQGITGWKDWDPGRGHQFTYNAPDEYTVPERKAKQWDGEVAEPVPPSSEEQLLAKMAELKALLSGAAGNPPQDRENSTPQLAEPLPADTRGEAKTEPFDPARFGGKELCFVVAASKTTRRADLERLARVLTHKVGVVYRRSQRQRYRTPLEWVRNDRDGFRGRMDRLRAKARREGWWDAIPSSYATTSYGWKP